MKSKKAKVRGKKMSIRGLYFINLIFRRKGVIFMLLMAVINRRSGMASGISKIWQAVAASDWKGLQVVRNYAGDIGNLKTKTTNKVRSKMNEFARRFHTLPLETRQAWDHYAGTLGSAVDRERSDNVSNAKNIIPRHRRALQSGINAYVSANINAYLMGLAAPFDIPATGAAVPPPPLDVDVTYGGGIATVNFIDPVLADSPAASKVRLWGKVFSKGSHAQLFTPFVALPSGGSTTFTEVRIGKGWASPKKLLSSFREKPILRVQMDTIVQRKPDEAPVIGPGSNVAEVYIDNP